jgi:hypothetical protein
LKETWESLVNFEEISGDFKELMMDEVMVSETRGTN